MNVVSWIASVVFLAIVFIWVTSRSSDPYGEFHLALNKVDDLEPPTEWLNMGYWRHTQVFPEACQALALKLVEATDLKQGATILDVGHGSGESLIMLLTHPSVPRPSKLVGITSLDVHHKRSRARVARLDQRVPVDTYLGDAVYRAECEGSHPLDPASEVQFDAILALDCAYHFETRWTFLQQSYDRLRPGGGVVALADICFAPGALQSRWTRCVMAVLRVMPHENMVSTDEYVAHMRRMGYTDVRLEDVTPDVFPGFIKFLRTRGVLFKIFAMVMRVLEISGARFVIVRGTT